MLKVLFYIVVIQPHNVIPTAKVIRRAGHVNRPEILGLEEQHERLLENWHKRKREMRRVMSLARRILMEMVFLRSVSGWNWLWIVISGGLCY